MPADRPFEYAIVRLVPRIERGERLNVGVILFCRQAGGFLRMRWALDEDRTRILWPDLEPSIVEHSLTALEQLAAGELGSGPLAALEPSERFGLLVAPSSTILQPSKVHTGLCDDPEGELDVLFTKLVG